MAELTGIRGINYIASYAVNTTEMWGDFNAALMDADLSLAESTGFNSVRVWLSSDAFYRNKSGFVDAFAVFLDLCAKRNLTVIPILFDSCGVARQEPYELVTVAERFELLRKGNEYDETVRNYILGWLKGYVENIAGAALCQKHGSATSILWEQWQSNPGYDNLGEPQRERYHDYVDALVDGFRNDSRIVLWDIMNEPWVYEVFVGKADDPLPGAFARYYCEYVRAKNCGIPITVGCAAMARSVRFADLTDVLSFHSYDLRGTLRKRIEEAQAESASRKQPALLSECLSVIVTHPEVMQDLGDDAISDAGQLRYIERAYPIIEQSGLPWYAWQLIAGKACFAYSGLYYPSGYARPAARWLKKALSAG